MADNQDSNEALAQTYASLLTRVPESARRAELYQLRKTNPVIHKLVIAEIIKIRNQARLQGGEQPSQ